MRTDEIVAIAMTSLPIVVTVFGVPAAMASQPLLPIARSFSALTIAGIAAIAGALGCVPSREQPRAESATSGSEPAAIAPRGDTAETTPTEPAALENDSLGLAWRGRFDTQSELLVFESTIVESGWEGILQHDVRDGRELVRFAGADETFRAGIGVDAHHDPVLVHLGSFVLARDRGARLARFEPPRAEPRWISGACTRLYAAALAGGEIAAFCGSGALPPAPFPPGALVLLDAATGAERARVALPATTPFEEHAVLVAHGVIAVRAGDRVILADASPRVIADLDRPHTFGLAATERGFAIVENGVGLVEIDPASGATLRRIAHPLHGTAHPFTSRLGRLVVHDGTAYVEAGGTIHALSLAGGHARWSAAGEGVTIDRDLVYACRGGHFVVLDTRGGDTLFSYSTGTCRVTGVSGSRVLVRYEALPERTTSADLVWAGVLAFERRPGPPAPCERATVRGEVRVNGSIAPGLTVRAGNAWAVESSGVVHLWGGPMTPTAEPAAATVETDALGRYVLEICERGHVPIVVDPEQARALAGEEKAHDVACYVHLDGRGSYSVDFAVRAHGPTF